jgi:hypothetical protein
MVLGRGAVKKGGAPRSGGSQQRRGCVRLTQRAFLATADDSQYCGNQSEQGNEFASAHKKLLCQAWRNTTV